MQGGITVCACTMAARRAGKDPDISDICAEVPRKRSHTRSKRCRTDVTLEIADITAISPDSPALPVPFSRENGKQTKGSRRDRLSDERIFIDPFSLRLFSASICASFTEANR